MLQLSHRPLSGSAVDGDLFVDRAAEMDTLAKAYDLRFNTLLLGSRGLGVTSLTHQLRRRLDRQDVRSVHVDSAGAGDLGEFVDRVDLALTGPIGPTVPTKVDVSGITGSPFERTDHRDPDPLWSLRRLGDGIEDRPLVIVDNAHDPDLVHTVFGRFRDELWELPFTWLVCGVTNRRGDYLRPPADSFFETVVDVQPLTDTASGALLERRLDDATTGEQPTADRIRHHLDAIVKSGEGSPRQLLTGAREVAIGATGTADAAVSLVHAAAALGRSEAMLVAELRSLGSASASDDVLLDRLGWTRSRTTQVFRKLLDAEIVVAESQRDSGPGRPRKVYSLNLAGFEEAALS